MAEQQQQQLPDAAAATAAAVAADPALAIALGLPSAPEATSDDAGGVSVVSAADLGQGDTDAAASTAPATTTTTTATVAGAGAAEGGEDGDEDDDDDDVDDADALEAETVSWRSWLSHLVWGGAAAAERQHGVEGAEEQTEQEQEQERERLLSSSLDGSWVEIGAGGASVAGSAGALSALLLHRSAAAGAGAAAGGGGGGAAGADTAAAAVARAEAEDAAAARAAAKATGVVVPKQRPPTATEASTPSGAAGPELFASLAGAAAARRGTDGACRCATTAAASRAAAVQRAEAAVAALQALEEAQVGDAAAGDGLLASTLTSAASPEALRAARREVAQARAAAAAATSAPLRGEGVAPFACDRRCAVCGRDVAVVTWRVGQQGLVAATMLAAASAHVLARVTANAFGALSGYTLGLLFPGHDRGANARMGAWMGFITMYQVAPDASVGHTAGRARNAGRRLFGASEARHHCRSCGRTMCASCLSQGATLPLTPTCSVSHKVCADCVRDPQVTREAALRAVQRRALKSAATARPVVARFRATPTASSRAVLAVRLARMAEGRSRYQLAILRDVGPPLASEDADPLLAGAGAEQPSSADGGEDSGEPPQSFALLLTLLLQRAVARASAGVTASDEDTHMAEDEARAAAEDASHVLMLLRALTAHNAAACETLLGTGIVPALAQVLADEQGNTADAHLVGAAIVAEQFAALGIDDDADLAATAAATAAAAAAGAGAGAGAGAAEAAGLSTSVVDIDAAALLDDVPASPAVLADVVLGETEELGPDTLARLKQHRSLGELVPFLAALRSKPGASPELRATATHVLRLMLQQRLLGLDHLGGFGLNSEQGERK